MPMRNRYAFVRAGLAAFSYFGLAAGILASVQGAQGTGSSGVGLIGAVIGRVVDGSSGAPIVDALVATPGRPGDVCQTDGQGRFVFFDLPAGPLVFTARRDGYAPGSSVAPLSGRVDSAFGEQPLISDGGREPSTVTVWLWRYASISGQVTDERGDPVVDAAVEAW